MAEWLEQYALGVTDNYDTVSNARKLIGGRSRAAPANSTRLNSPATLPCGCNVIPQRGTYYDTTVVRTLGTRNAFHCD